MGLVTDYASDMSMSLSLSYNFICYFCRLSVRLFKNLLMQFVLKEFG